MKSKTKSTLIFIALIAFLALIAYLVLAVGVSVNNIRISSPANSTNFSSDFTLSVTFTNLTFGPNGTARSILTEEVGFNFSCYINMSGVWTLINNSGGVANASPYLLESNTSFSLTVDVSNITDQKGLALNCTVSNTSDTHYMEITNMSSNIIIDDTVPAVIILTSNITASSRHNYSETDGLLVLNASVIDALINLSRAYVYFNFTNASNGKQIVVYRAQQDATTNYFSNSTVNTTVIPDGIYNITVYANDSLGNLNKTEFIHTIYIDNTKPDLAWTCTPASPEEGQPCSCACTGTDATVGINMTYGFVTSTTGTGTATNPSTASAGIYTLTCSAKDNEENTQTKEYSLIVSDVQPAKVSGGGGAAAAAPVVAWTSTRSITNEEFTQGYTKQLAAKNRLKVAVEGTNHFVGVLSLTGTTATIEVSSTPQQATLSVGDVRRFDVTGDGSYDVQVTLNGIADNKADVTVKSISEIITPATEEEEVAKETAAAGEEVEVGKPLLKSVWFWIVVIVVVLVIVYVVYKKKR